MEDSVRPDYRKSLRDLHNEWCDCTACELGQQRKEANGAFVFGEGTKGGLMFIGEGPGRVEEQKGQPFVGRSGKVLRHVVEKMGLTHASYFTNVVTCRSCAQSYDGEGNPRYRTDRRTGLMVPVIQDCPPTPAQIATCVPRLYEEIYLVDPVLLVALGAEAAKTISRASIGILAENATTKEITIPGAGYHASLTAKRKVWARKRKTNDQGGFIVDLPGEQNQVRYLMMPVLHPAYLVRRFKDGRHGNPLQLFVEGMRKAASIYDRYMLEVYGMSPIERELREEDVQTAINDEEGDD